MPKCDRVHLEKRGRATVVVPHWYIAGICVTHMTPATRAFLETTFPYYQSHEYERSRQLCFDNDE
jgi:hypothetical protein